jgi:hypothetical protein
MRETNNLINCVVQVAEVKLYSFRTLQQLTTDIAEQILVSQIMNCQPSRSSACVTAIETADASSAVSYPSLIY